MRDDMAKNLSESYRVGGGVKFRDLRNRKVFNDDEYGQREGMRWRYKATWSAKEFGEHLTPLQGWLRTCLGKKWDDCYSELRSKFDMRKVINAHIMDHLYSYIETNAVIDDDGSICFYGNRFNSGLQPIEKCYKDYYVCPKSKIVKRTHPVNTISRKNANKNKRDVEQAKVLKFVGNDAVLRNIDGIWFYFDLKNVPVATVSYLCPNPTDTWSVHVGWKRKLKTWDELNGQERELYGIKTRSHGAIDEYTHEPVYAERKSNGTIEFYGRIGRYDPIPVGKYHANKRTATSKELKAAGVSNVYNEDIGAVNHREYAAWKKAA